MVKMINCLLPSIEEVFGRSYYWCIDQCEFATDINFKSCEELSCFYRTLVETFDNKSIRRRIYENNDTPQTINKTTRLLAKLKAHGIIKKVPRKNWYYLTSRGRDITNTLLLFLNKDLLNAA